MVEGSWKSEISKEIRQEKKFAFLAQHLIRMEMPQAAKNFLILADLCKKKAAILHGMDTANKDILKKKRSRDEL
jgi:hypothetical protein